MTASKIVIIGKLQIPVTDLSRAAKRPIELIELSAEQASKPLDGLDASSIVLLQATAENERSLEIIRHIRRQFRALPILLVVSHPTVDYLVQAYRYGLTDCLPGPGASTELVGWLLAYLEESEPARESFAMTVTALKNLPAIAPVTERPAQLSACFVGSFRLFQQGERLKLPGGARQRSLLAFLLYHGHAQVHRDKIIQNFWPDHDPNCAKNNLNVGICNLRKHLEPFFKQEVICFNNGYFFLNRNISLHRDIDQFNQHYRLAREAEHRGQLAEAAQEYQNALQLGSEFLEEFQQDDWTVHPREEFTEKCFHALDQISSFQHKTQRYEAALHTLRHMLCKDDCLESAHAKMISCYLALGKNDKAVRQYQECARVLSEKLKMRPSQETETLYQQARGYALVA